jgi:hypothetical protein
MERERLVGSNRRPEIWISHFLDLLPTSLQAQSRMAGNHVAADRAKVLHPALLVDRDFLGCAVDYLTPMEVRGILVKEHENEGKEAALATFKHMRFQNNLPGGWAANYNLFHGAAAAVTLTGVERYNQAVIWLQHVPWWAEAVIGMSFGRRNPEPPD